MYVYLQSLTTTMQKMKNQKNNKYLSLYDFLKRAAGPELGAVVEAAARKKKVKIKSREISNPVYSGKVCLYPESFLKEYFGHG